MAERAYPAPMAALLAPRTFRIVFWLAAAFAMVMAVLPQPPAIMSYDVGDKVEHVLAFVTLAALAHLGFPGAPGRLILERLSFLGAAIEVVQSIPALHRDCDVRDWIVDTVAVALVCAVFALWRRRSVSKPGALL